MKVKPIKPEKLPIRDLNSTALADLISQAHFALGSFEALTSKVENPQAVFSLLIKQEALNSLHAQHISIRLEHLLEDETLDKAKQVRNYERAWKEASSILKKEPISLALIKKMQSMIRGKSNKTQPTGQKFRAWQNWIGPEGGKIEEAYFFPPKPSQVTKYMENLIRYLRLKDQDKLVQLAVFFAQLLIIHPFMDGNGRLARLLIPLIFSKKKTLSHPLFFMSGYFMKHRVRYFQKLYDISAEGDWEGWVRFFLIGIIEQGKQNCAQAQALTIFYIKLRTTLDSLLTTEDAKKVAAYIFQHPVFQEADLIKKVVHSSATARRLTSKLAELGFLKRRKDKKEKRWFAPPLLRICRLQKQD